MLIIICSKPVVAINIYQKVCWKNPRISNITSGCYESEVDNFIFKNDKNLLWDEIGKKKSSKLLNTWFLRIVIKISSKMTHFYAYFDINFRTKLSYWFKRKKSPFLTIFELWLERACKSRTEILFNFVLFNFLILFCSLYYLLNYLNIMRIIYNISNLY